jgi:two-component system, response regulator
MLKEAWMKIDILLVEDSAEDAELAIRVIKQDNPAVRVKLLKDGADAVNYFFDESKSMNKHIFPKVIFLDIKLPRLTGFEVLKILKSNEATRSIPVIVMSSSCQKGDIEGCYSLGANSYLVKPIDFTSFQAMIINTYRYWLNYNIPLPA